MDKMNETLIFETIHGSHLYGLNHSESDRDIYRVVLEPIKSRVELGMGDDVNIVSLGRFLDLIHKGRHQAIETLMSMRYGYGTWYKPEYEAMFKNMNVYSTEIEDAYLRVIKSGCYGDYKRRLQSIRMTYNLGSLRRWGHFDPRLKKYTKEYFLKFAREDSDDVLWNLLREGIE